MMRARSFVSPRRLERVGGAMRAALAAAQEPAQRTSEKGRGRVDIVRRDGLAAYRVTPATQPLRAIDPQLSGSVLIDDYKLLWRRLIDGRTCSRTSSRGSTPNADETARAVGT